MLQMLSSSPGSVGCRVIGGWLTSPRKELRDWLKSIGGGGGPASGGGSPYFILTTNEKVDYTCYIKHSQLELLLKYSQTFCARKYKG